MLHHTNITGAVSEAMVSGHLAAKGCEVFAATQSHSRADLIYVQNGRTVRVQVKTSSVYRRGNYLFELCRLVRKGINLPYSPDEVDEVWIVGTHLWCFPIKDIQDLTSISLCSSNPTPRKTTRTYDPDKYIRVMGSLDRPFKDRLFCDDPLPSLYPTSNEYASSTLRKLSRRK